MAAGISRYDGVLLLGKPKGITSHDAVNEIRRITGQRRVGHCGTLDPLARGLLLMCLGRATKLTQFLTGLDKTYEAEICLGQISETGDSEGVKEDMPRPPAPDIPQRELEQALNGFAGVIRQRVPAYSAVRVGGRPMYELARRGIPVERPEREVEIKSLSLVDYQPPLVHLLVRCSHGTYIRALADDLGGVLGCGAYLSGLRRTAVGHFTIEQSLSLERVQELHQEGKLQQCLLAAAEVLPYPTVIISGEGRKHVLHGNKLTPDFITRHDGSFDVGDIITIRDQQGNVLAVGRAETASDQIGRSTDKTFFSYSRVLN
ncbi:MAG: tRNA pseudouridine(55) synthase TruB [Candidatus Zixiibacteriota bacterium]